MSDRTKNVHTKATGEKGNGLYASKLFAPGELILSIEKPPVAVLNNSSLDLSCSNCFAYKPKDAGSDQADGINAASLSTCAGCHTLRYCSKVGLRFPDSFSHHPLFLAPCMYDFLTAKSIDQVHSICIALPRFLQDDI